eukprot:PhF_6_TR40586/c0_g1_i1/m.60860/K10758/QSOX; thiol oxidase
MSTINIVVVAILITVINSQSLYRDAPEVLEVRELPPTNGCPYYTVFYVGWCGHCQAFAPGYKIFAQEFSNDTYGTMMTAIDCVQNHGACVKEGIHGFPTVIYNNGMKSQRVVPEDGSGYKLPRFKPIPALMDGQAQSRCFMMKQRKLRIWMKNRGASSERGKAVWFDKEASFKHSLDHEVLDSIRIAASAGTAARSKRVSVLRYFIGNATAAMPELRSLSVLNADTDAPLPIIKGCGFTCGMWRLYHTMVIFSPDPVAALYSIRDYVQTFFTCLSCRKHFTKMAESIPDEVTDARSAKLWLWKAHNKVNLRLNKNVTHFPPSSTCPKCDNGNNEGEVLKFLEHYYRPNVVGRDRKAWSSSFPVFQASRKASSFNEMV